MSNETFQAKYDRLAQMHGETCIEMVSMMREHKKETESLRDMLHWYADEDACRCGPVGESSRLLCRGCKARKLLKEMESK